MRLLSIQPRPCSRNEVLDVNGPVLFERVSGLADRESRRVLRIDDVWRWASVTKQVTASLVMHQVHSGRIVLDAPVSRYLPEFVGPASGRITVRHLLQHTSGLPNQNDTPRNAAGIPPFYAVR